MLNQCAVCEVADSLSFSAISCSFFKLLSQITRKLCCFQSALSFYGKVFAVRRDDTIWFSGKRRKVQPPQQNYSLAELDEKISALKQALLRKSREAESLATHHLP
ncbi:MAP3K12-binding inhibitory protein 1 [Vulpes lagopus]